MPSSRRNAEFLMVEFLDGDKVIFRGSCSNIGSEIDLYLYNCKKQFNITAYTKVIGKIFHRKHDSYSLRKTYVLE